MLSTKLIFARVLPLAMLLLVNSTESIAGLREILPRPQQMGKLAEFPMIVIGTFYLVTPDSPTPEELTVQAEVTELLQEHSSRTPIPVQWSDYTGEYPAIWMGTESRFPELAEALDSTGISGLGTITQSEEYQLVVQEDRILLLGEDYRALRWGILSLIKLLGETNGILAVDRVYVRDWPDYPIRVASVNMPMRNEAQDEWCNAVLDTAYACKMNEIEWNGSETGLPPDSFDSWTRAFYFPHAEAYRQKIHDKGMKLTVSCERTAAKIDDFSWQEAIPITNTPMRVTSSGFAVIPDGYNISVPNGGFESWSGSIPNNWTLWRDSLWSHFSRDFSIRHSGASSIKIQTPGNSMALRQYIDIQPYGYYNLKFWLKTSNYSGRLFIDAQGREPATNSMIMLTRHIALTNSTQDWTEYVFPFSSYHLNEVLLMVGLRDLSSGTAWLDDVRIEAAGLERMVRRSDTPLNVYEEPGHILRTEGVDYRVVETYSRSYNNYVHSPRLERISGGALALNDEVSVDWGCAILFQDVRYTVCFSLLEPLQYFQERVRQADSLLNPDGYKIQINEISYAGHDQLCQSRNLSPAQLVGQYCNQLYGIIRAQNPTASVRIYGDAFDIYNLDMRAMPTDYRPWQAGEGGAGSLQQLQNDVEIMAMSDYSSDLDSTFINYEQNGFPSVVALYGDYGLWQVLPASIKARRYPGCRGSIVYAWGDTWYYEMPLFASVAWNIGPYILHTPVLPGLATDSVAVRAEVWSDTLASSQAPQIVNVVLRYRWPPSGSWIEVTMQQASTDQYTVTIPPGGQTAEQLEYTIIATDNRELTRTAPAGTSPETFVVNFSSGAPERLDRSYIEIEHTVTDMGDFLLIEWPPVSTAPWYEVHLGPRPEFGANSRTLLVRQSPSTPRYLLRKDLFENSGDPRITVISAKLSDKSTGSEETNK